VESNRRGVRSVKTTTDKRGRWCAPKASVYRDGRTTKMFVLACHPDERAGWITLCVEGGYSGGVQLCHANNDTIRIAGCPFASTPLRYGVGNRPASSITEIEAFDAWARGLEKLADRIAVAIANRNGVLAQVAK